MNKTELIDAIAGHSGLTKADSKKALDSFIIATSVTLKKGGVVDILGWGRLEVHTYKKRTWKNKKGKTIVVPVRKHVHFTESESLDEAIN
jgi:DNA-binding protein HU-beta